MDLLDYDTTIKDENERERDLIFDRLIRKHSRKRKTAHGQAKLLSQQQSSSVPEVKRIRTLSPPPKQTKSTLPTLPQTPILDRAISNVGEASSETKTNFGVYRPSPSPAPKRARPPTPFPPRNPAPPPDPAPAPALAPGGDIAEEEKKAASFNEEDKEYKEEKNRRNRTPEWLNITAQDRDKYPRLFLRMLDTFDWPKTFRGISNVLEHMTPEFYSIKYNSVIYSTHHTMKGKQTKKQMYWNYNSSNQEWTKVSAIMMRKLNDYYPIGVGFNVRNE